MKKNPFVKKSKTTVIEKNYYEWGLFFWRKADGHLFGDGNGNLLCIEASSKYDIDAMQKIRAAAAHYGEPDGRPWFQPGVKKVTDEEYSEQKDRMVQGLIPNLNDMGAVYDEKQYIKRFGNE